MQRRLVHVLVFTAARVVSAEETVEDRTPVPDAPTYEYQLTAEGLAALAPRTGWSAGLFATVAGTAERGGRTGTLAVGGQVATPGISDGCRYLRAEGAVYSAAAGDARYQSADVTTRTCLFRADVVDTGGPGFAAEHHVAYELRPALSARRTLLRRRYTGQSVRVDGSAFEARDSKLPYGAALFPYHVDVDTVAQDGLHQLTWGLTIEAVRITPPETILFGDPRAPDGVIHVPADELAVLGLFMRAGSTATHDVTVGGMNLARIDRLRVGAGIALDAQLGFAVSTVVRKPDAPMEAEPAPEADVTTPRGYVGASQRRDALAWTARYARDAFPTMDGAIAVEDRLTGTVELLRYAPGVQVAGFAAHTAVYEAMGGSSGAWTAGVAVARSWQLGDHLSLLVSAEAARSYYARLDGTAPPTPEPAARALAVLSGHLGHR